MQDDLVAQGAQLMLFGMGTVLLFLTLLVLATTLMSRLIERYFEEPHVAETGPGGVPAGEGAEPDDALVTVISAAVHRYRSRRR
jgi:oxaloacetate decarboxylase gamma subunit